MPSFENFNPYQLPGEDMPVYLAHRPASNKMRSKGLVVKDLRRVHGRVSYELLIDLITNPKFFNTIGVYTLIIDLTDRLNITNVHLSGLLVMAYANGGMFSARNISSMNIGYISPDEAYAGLTEAGSQPDESQVGQQFLRIPGFYGIPCRDRFVSPQRLLDKAGDCFAEHYQNFAKYGEFLNPHVVVLYNAPRRPNLFSHNAKEELVHSFLNRDLEAPHTKPLRYVHNQFTLCEVV